ncbi:MAG: MerR family transcriptional regulator [Tissierellia bacterium]|nr:MerR family transcriptional regulator [Tissierellia bacterium]
MLEVDREYTISEVAEITGYPPHVLRYYEKEFDLQIPRNQSNHRSYTYIEIEAFQYIKSLQDKGFSNKQIKLIIKSPELLVDANDETALTSIDLGRENGIDSFELAREISVNLEERFFNNLLRILDNNNEYSIQVIEELKDEINALREELTSKERDVLICENAKLKMKVKEKSYETAELREKVKRMESEKGFLQRIFNISK